MTKADPEMGRLFFQADNVPPDMTAIKFALTPQAFPYFFIRHSLRFDLFPIPTSQRPKMSRCIEKSMICNEKSDGCGKCYTANRRTPNKRQTQKSDDPKIAAFCVYANC